MPAKPERLSKEDEQRLLHVVEDLTDLVKEGEHPNTALQQVADSFQLPPGHIRLAAQAYNVGRTNHQRKTASDLFSKTATFPLADAESVIKELFPKQTKSASDLYHSQVLSTQYEQPPDRVIGDLLRQDKLEKLACECLPSPGERTTEDESGVDNHKPHHRMVSITIIQHQKHKPENDKPPHFTEKKEPTEEQIKKSFSYLRQLEKEEDEQRLKIEQQHKQASDSYLDLLAYLKQHRYDLSLPTVEKQAALLYGDKNVADLFTILKQDPIIAKIDHRSYHGKYASAIDRNIPPYSLIEKCLSCREQHKLARDQYETFHKQAIEIKNQLTQKILPDNEQHPNYCTGSLLKPLFKNAILGPLLTGMTQGTAQAGAQEILNRAFPKTTPDVKKDVLYDVYDPEHEKKLQQIRAKAVVHDLMQDEFLQGENPDKVISLYNDITKMTPRAAQHPMLVKSLMRKYLQTGQMEPFDIGQLADIESKLKKLEEPMKSQQIGHERYPSAILVGSDFGKKKP